MGVGGTLSTTAKIRHFDHLTAQHPRKFARKMIHHIGMKKVG